MVKMIEIIGEDASCGATSGATASGNIATLVGTLWNGPTKGEYPYITPDYSSKRKKNKKKPVLIKRNP